MVLNIDKSSLPPLGSPWAFRTLPAGLPTTAIMFPAQAFGLQLGLWLVHMAATLHVQGDPSLVSPLLLFMEPQLSWAHSSPTDTRRLLEGMEPLSRVLGALSVSLTLLGPLSSC